MWTPSGRRPTEGPGGKGGPLPGPTASLCLPAAAAAGPARPAGESWAQPAPRPSALALGVAAAFVRVPEPSPACPPACPLAPGLGTPPTAGTTSKGRWTPTAGLGGARSGLQGGGAGTQRGCLCAGPEVGHPLGEPPFTCQHEDLAGGVAGTGKVGRPGSPTLRPKSEMWGRHVSGRRCWNLTGPLLGFGTPHLSPGGGAPHCTGGVPAAA